MNGTTENHVYAVPNCHRTYSKYGIKAIKIPVLKQLDNGAFVGVLFGEDFEFSLDGEVKSRFLKFKLFQSEADADLEVTDKYVSRAKGKFYQFGIDENLLTENEVDTLVNIFTKLAIKGW